MDKRPYHSPLRQEQAQATRARILDAALGLFGAGGYGATSIAAIAREAGVVPETIYATFGSKRGIVDGLIDRVATPQVVGEVEAAWAAGAGDPGDQLSVIAHLSTTFWGANGALASVFRSGIGESDIADEWATRQADRRTLFEHLLGSWPDSAFRTGLDRDEAIDIVWALATYEIYHLFVRDRGWSAGRFESWLHGALRREIVAG